MLDDKREMNKITEISAIKDSRVETMEFVIQEVILPLFHCTIIILVIVAKCIVMK